MKKGVILESLLMETMAAEGKCVARHEGRVVFTTGCAPGDVVDVEVIKVKSSYLEGRAVAIRSFSTERAEPFCSHFGQCGGCSWQHIRYDRQLEYKQQQVYDNLVRIGGLELPTINPILGSGLTKEYRNRLDFTFTASRWMTREELDAGGVMGQPGLGYHIPRMYDRVFDLDHCHLMDQPANTIRSAVRELAVREGIPFFDLRKQVGFLRTLTVRSTAAGEHMVILQVAYDEQRWVDLLLQAIADAVPAAASLNFIINGKRNDTFADLDVITWKGLPWITEKMQRPRGDGELQFRIGPKSFYQTNPRQAEVLYRTAWEFAALTDTELVYDLYTGTGTIANYVAADASKVVGLEYVEAAVEDARINSDLNGTKNTIFQAGDMKNLLTEQFISVHGKPDVVITDPPRAGMHEDVVKMLLSVSPQRIVYVSCNPATQARDLKILSEAYRITAVQPVDMFPQTMHVENVVGLVRR
ncbi:MAG: 23S rRNA (uracil(1939)-C(5))-methyltransferase RlmD [Bacteroidota bacterium]